MLTEHTATDTADTFDDTDTAAAYRDGAVAGALRATSRYHDAACESARAWAGSVEAGDARESARSLAPAEAEAVAEALFALPWGREPGGCFVTDRARDWSGGRSRAFWGPGRVLIASVAYCDFSERREVHVPLPSAARAAADEAAESRRQAQRAYDADLVDAARALRGAGVESLSDGARVGPWVHCSGQQGGRLVRDAKGADGWPSNVSARGALRRAWGEVVEITAGGGARVIGASRAEVAAAPFEARFERLDGARY